MSVSAAGCSIEVVFLHDQPPTNSVDRCSVLDSCSRGIANAAYQRRGVESAMSRASVREVSGSLPVIGDGGDHRHIQGLGDLIPSVRLALAYDDQTQVSADRGTELWMITERRQVDASTHDRPQCRGDDDGSQ